MSTAGSLGRIVHHDPRSRAYAFRAQITRTSVKHKRFAPVFDQGDIGSCTGNATLGALGTGPLYTALAAAGMLPTYTEPVAVSLYSEATKYDDVTGTYPPDDTGSSGLAAAKAAKRRGWLAGYQHAFSAEDALDALCLRPIIIGINWYSSFDSPDANGLIALPASATVRGGHEVVLDEIDVERQLVWFTNSWTASWGAAGRAAMSWATFDRLLAEDGDATILVPVSAPAPTPVVDPTPADPYTLSGPVNNRIAALAIHAHMTPQQWLEHHLRAYLKMAQS